jgi:hypothetical protein
VRQLCLPESIMQFLRVNHAILTSQSCNSYESPGISALAFDCSWITAMYLLRGTVFYLSLFEPNMTQPRNEAQSVPKHKADSQYLNGSWRQSLLTLIRQPPVPAGVIQRRNLSLQFPSFHAECALALRMTNVTHDRRVSRRPPLLWQPFEYLD